MDHSGNNTDQVNTGPNLGEENSDVQLPNICSICHYPPINAVQLNCGHIFCYLCIKSASQTTGTCALCRREIGIEFNYQDHEILSAARIPSSSNGYYWFYEGFRGWWLYDAETNDIIEEAYKRFREGGPSRLERFIAGSVYVIDMLNMTQQRQDGEGRSRKVCRETLELENILGMAGLKGRDFAEILNLMRSAQPVINH